MPETLTSPSTLPIARRRRGVKPQCNSAPRLLLQVADRIEQHLEYLAVAESWDNGKPIRETLNADLPLAVDHFRYFAGCLRAQEGSTAEIDETTVAYHFHEPLGVVGQIIPWNFPLLMAAWKLAPAPGGGELRGAQAGGTDAAKHYPAAGADRRSVPGRGA